MASPQTKNFSVSIVGGGVCGLTCAIALTREGVPVDVFESAVSITLFGYQLVLMSLQPKFSEIGAGLGVGTAFFHALPSCRSLMS